MLAYLNARQVARSQQTDRQTQTRVCMFVHKYKTTKCSVDKKNQLDVTFCILYFSSNSWSTCFGQPCAHHQELATA